MEAYKIAAKSTEPGRTVRVILMSDGVANVGPTGADSMLELVKTEVNRQIYLTTIGVGMGNFNDVLMEQLANNGNGTYHYIDNIKEAKKLFQGNLTGILQNVADDAKIQVEFNTDSVRSYRLLGYENRRVDDDQFRQDDVDAGEVGSGQNVTALYEMKLQSAQEGQTPPDPVATVRVRYRNPETGETQETTRDFLHQDITSDPLQTSPAFRLAAGVAEFSEILRRSYWAQDGSFQAVQDWTYPLAQQHYPNNQQVTELNSLVQRAKVTLAMRGGRQP